MKYTKIRPNPSLPMDFKTAGRLGSLDIGRGGRYSPTLSDARSVSTSVPDNGSPHQKDHFIYKMIPFFGVNYCSHRRDCLPDIEEQLSDLVVALMTI